ncbi:MAG TPA: amidohydrolase family protein [Bacteroidales bacterium]|nr:amidohydrolase family protein [Bacteroidales bacterium]
MEARKFYDIHFHEMDLGHANITAFLNRFLNEKNGLLNTKNVAGIIRKKLPRWSLVFIPLLLPILPFISYSFVSNKIIAILKKHIMTKKVRNLLSFMESSIIYDFLVVDYFLKNREPRIVTEDNEMFIGGVKYDKIVLCPLIIDFGYMNLNNKEIFYNIPPQKPITRQIKDLFEAIETYYCHDLQIKNHNGNIKFEVKKIERNEKKKLFEIYPFMGLNTQHYDIGEVKQMLNKYFCDFSKDDSREERHNKLRKKMGHFKGNLDDEEDCKNIFAGIKLYPALGFEPWPEDSEQQEKVDYLYDFCISKRIPIITHCSTGGFVADSDCVKFSDPSGQWEKVIQKKHGLKINFAHFGSDSEEWTAKIIEYMYREDSEVYADFSCNTSHDECYKKMKAMIEKSEDPELLTKRILFGSDFMINLLWLNSYNEYLKEYSETHHINEVTRDLFANINSERFLFG